MNQFITWFNATRPKFFTGTVVPVVLGSVIAWYQFNTFNWYYFFLTFIGGIFIHAGLDLANDYFDHTSGVDEKNRFYSPFNGGSRFIQDGILKPVHVLYASIICFLIGITIGLYLNFVLPGNILLIIGIIGVFLAFFYTADPVRIGYTGFGEIAVGLGFGPVMVLGSYFVQAKQLTLVPFLASIPVAILIALVLFINEFPDYEADKAGNKKTLVVILGKQKAIKIYYILSSFIYVWVIIGVMLKVYPYYALLVFVTLPLFFKAIKVAKLHYDKIQELLPANAATIGLHLTIGILLSVSYLIDKIIK